MVNVQETEKMAAVRQVCRFTVTPANRPMEAEVEAYVIFLLLSAIPPHSYIHGLYRSPAADGYTTSPNVLSITNPSFSPSTPSYAVVRVLPGTGKQKHSDINCPLRTFPFSDKSYTDLQERLLQCGRVPLPTDRRYSA